MANHETSVRKRQEIAEETEKLSEKNKCAESAITTLERNLSRLREENVKLKSVNELSERGKKLMEKTTAKVNGRHQ